jgi:hypothetical protein
MRSKPMWLVAISLGLAGLGGCSRSVPPVAQANADSAATAQVATPTAPGPGVEPGFFTLDAGVAVPVRLQNALNTRRNRVGDRFTATLDEPLVSGDRVVVPKGTPLSGHITRAQASGRFKGRAVLALTLDSLQLNGETYQVSSTNALRESGGHKKRNWLWSGGGAGGGAAIGGAVAGGAGALIGAGAGAAAGTVGAAITGKRHVELPVETRITFKLRSPVEIARS